MTDSLKISPWQPWIALLLGIVNALVYVCSIILMIRGLYLTCIRYTRPTAEAHNVKSIGKKLILVLDVTLLRLRAKISF